MVLIVSSPLFLVVSYDAALLLSFLRFLDYVDKSWSNRYPHAETKEIGIFSLVIVQVN